MITITEAQKYYDDTDSAHDFAHVRRVLTLAERIGRAEGADMEIVRAAALLHDVGRAQAVAAGRDHAAFAAERTREILAGRPAERVEAVVEAVAAHRFRTEPAPATLEAQVVFDADKLDSIGAVGVARAFAYSGARGEPLWAPADEPNGSHTPRHEFAVKLSRVKERLYTATGRALAEERHAFMVAFFERMAAEVRGEV